LDTAMSASKIPSAEQDCKGGRKSTVSVERNDKWEMGVRLKGDVARFDELDRPGFQLRGQGVFKLQ